MKKFFAGWIILALGAALAAARTVTFSPSATPNTTNNAIMDCRGASSLSVEATGLGTGWYACIISLTNNPNTSGTNTLGINFNGTNTVYTWTTNSPPVTNQTILTERQFAIGVTNADNGINGNTLILNFGNTALAYPVSTQPGSQQITSSSVSANAQATNVFNFISNNFPGFTLAYTTNANVFTLTTTNLGLTSITQSGISNAALLFTNGASLVYVTNTSITTNSILLAGLTAPVAAQPRTQIVLGVTNSDAGTASNYLNVVLGTYTASYLIVTNAGTGQISNAATAPALATNVFNFLSAVYPSFTLTLATNIITIVTLTNDVLSVSQVGADFTNASSTIYLATNTVATNLFYLIPGTNTAGSATNLLAVINRDYPSITGSVATNILNLYSQGIPLSATNSNQSTNTSWCAITSSTNTGGNIGITATVSGNMANWLSFPSLNLLFPLSATATNAGTNALLYGWPYVQFTIFDASTNGACPGLQLIITSQ